MKRYLKSYDAIATGSEREYGYSYTDYQVFNSIEEVAKYHGTKRDEKYFEIHSVNEEDFQREIQKAKERIEEQRREEEIARKRRQLEELKAELGEA
jgi:hypothetical protein